MRKIVVKKTEKSSDILKKLKKELNKGQFAAATHIKGESLVIAGAGTGKTRTLTYRVAYLIDQGESPSSIYLMTFTKKAAQEMITRCDNLIGNDAKQVKAGTFHHHAHLCLRKYAKAVGFRNNFTIADSTDQNTIMKLVRAEAMPTDKSQAKLYPKTKDLINIQTKRINLGIPLSEVLDKFYPNFGDLQKEIDTILTNYLKEKRAANKLDFDDLLIYYLDFLKKPASKKYKSQIKHVLVDEYQDVNKIQALIVQELAELSDSLMVVGDDAQAIYGFRGSDYTFMLNFPKEYPDCEKYYLTENYRSSPEILKLSNKSINLNKKQFKKELEPTKSSSELPWICVTRDRGNEAKILVQQIVDFREEDIPLKEQAVLFRSSFHCMALEKELIERDIPYEIRGGQKYFEKAHIKDFLALLTLPVAPEDKFSWMRIMPIHDGISDKSALKIISYLKSVEEKNLMKTFVSSDLAKELKGQRIMKKGFKSLMELQKFYNDFDSKASLSNIVKYSIKYIIPLIKQKYKNHEDRINELKEITYFIQDYEDLQSFLADAILNISFQTPLGDDEEEEEYEAPLVLSTIHQAKGLEWDIVYIISCYEGGIPSSRSIGKENLVEEERRLFYVACTRARKYLCLSYPQTVYGFDFSEYNVVRSSFINEIDDSNDPVFEEAEIEFD